MTRKLIIGTIASLLTGCGVSGISTVPDDIAAPAGWARGGEVGNVDTDWLSTFGDPRLEELVADSLAGNFGLEQERQRLAAARSAAVVVRSARFPTLDLSLDGSRRGNEDAGGDPITSDSFNAGIGARFDVDLWGRLSSAQKSAELALAAQAARLQAEERNLAGATASQYFDVIEATQLLAVAERRLEIAIQSRDVVASGYRQGLNDALDLYLARNQVQRQQANFAQQQQSYTESVADLQLTLARYPDGTMEIDGELPVINEPIPVGLPSELLTRRPDIREAWLNLLAADADLAAAHKARFPSLSLVGSSGVTSAEFGDLLDSEQTFWNVAGGLTQPLFAGGRLKALEEQAAARVQLVEQQYLQIVYRAFADVENAISRSVSLQERYDSFLDAETNSRAALTLALEQYQRGLVSYTTVLESQRQAFDAEATVVQLRNQLLQNRIALFLALGGSFSSGT